MSKSNRWKKTLGITLFAFVIVLDAGCASIQTEPQSTTESHPKGTASETTPDIVGRGRRISRSTSPSPISPAALLALDDEAVPDLQIHIFANDQADSMLIIGPPPTYRSILVDAGEPVVGAKNKAEQILQRVKSLTGGTHVNYVLISHFHLDHAGTPGDGPCHPPGRTQSPTGIFALFDGIYGPFTTDTLFDPGDDDQNYIPANNVVHCGIKNDAPGWIQSGKIHNRATPALGTSAIDLGPSVSTEVLAVSGRVRPDENSYMDQVAASNSNLYSESQPASENDRSIAFQISLGDFDFFSGGDLTGSPLGHEGDPYDVRSFGSNATVYTNVESHLVQYWKSIGRKSDVEVYRADHHGSGHSSNADLAGELRPQVVVFSCGTNNYGHPDKGTVGEFRDMGAAELVTSGFDPQMWPNGLDPTVNLVRGDIDILVWDKGARFSVNGQMYQSHAHHQ